MPPSKEDLLHLAMAANQRKLMGFNPSGDLRLCRKFNGRAGKKQFCLAEFHGDNLAIPLLFFLDRPTPDVLCAAKELAMREIDNPSSTLIQVLQELSDEREAETEGRNAEAGNAAEGQREALLT